MSTSNVNLRPGLNGLLGELVQVNQSLARFSRRENAIEGEIERIEAQIEKVVNQADAQVGASRNAPSLQQKEVRQKNLQDEIDEMVDGSECLLPPQNEVNDGGPSDGGTLFPGLPALPAEIASDAIFSFLDLKDIAKSAHVNRAWNEAAQSVESLIDEQIKSFAGVIIPNDLETQEKFITECRNKLQDVLTEGTDREHALKQLASIFAAYIENPGAVFSSLNFSDYPLLRITLGEAMTMYFNELLDEGYTDEAYEFMVGHSHGWDSKERDIKLCRLAKIYKEQGNYNSVLMLAEQISDLNRVGEIFDSTFCCNFMLANDFNEVQRIANLYHLEEKFTNAYLHRAEFDRHNLDRLRESKNENELEEELALIDAELAAIEESILNNIRGALKLALRDKKVRVSRVIFVFNNLRSNHDYGYNIILLAKEIAESMGDEEEQLKAYYFIISALKDKDERALAAEIVSSIQNEETRGIVGKLLR